MLQPGKGKGIESASNLVYVMWQQLYGVSHLFLNITPKTGVDNYIAQVRRLRLRCN